VAKGIREREFQNLMIQWSLPMGWAFTAGRSLPRETTQTVIAGQLRDAIVRLNERGKDMFGVKRRALEVLGETLRAEDRLLRLLGEAIELHGSGRHPDRVSHQH